MWLKVSKKTCSLNLKMLSIRGILKVSSMQEKQIGALTVLSVREIISLKEKISIK
jgi:hypothetical protein